MINSGAKRRIAIKHLESSRTNKEVPSSRATLAALGTTAMQIEDRITMSIPRESFEGFLSFNYRSPWKVSNLFVVNYYIAGQPADRS